VADDIELYDIPPVFQNRMLKWLGKHQERLTISVVDDKFLVTPREARGGSSQHKSLEHALNHAMGSRAETGHIRTRFATKVRQWLAAENAKMIISSNGDLFVVELHGDSAMSRDEDEDLEVALVLAEEQYGASEVPGSRADTVAAPTLRDVEPMTLEAPTRYDVEPETEEAPTRFRIGDDERTVREAGLSENAHWSRAYVNSLPDSAFLHVEPGGKRDRLGRSHPLTLRHLPYKNRSGRIDKAHLRAAMSRAHQGKTKLPAATKERVFRRAQEIYGREFGSETRMAANAPPRRHARASTTLRGRELPSTRTLIEREEARQRRDERPFDPEERTEHYAKPHHFAVNDRSGASARHDGEDILREVMLDDTGYVLVLWDTHRTDSYDKSILGYAFYEPAGNGKLLPTPLFEGEDFAASPMDAIDSDETVRGLLGFLTLRPGDTDREYFASYTPEQMAFAEGPAEELQMFGMEPDAEFEPPPLIDV